MLVSVRKLVETRPGRVEQTSCQVLPLQPQIRANLQTQLEHLDSIPSMVHMESDCVRDTAMPRLAMAAP